MSEHDPKAYQAEVEERWGHTGSYAQSKRRTGSYTPDDWARISGKKGERIINIRTLIAGHAIGDDRRVTDVPGRSHELTVRGLAPAPAYRVRLASAATTTETKAACSITSTPVRRASAQTSRAPTTRIRKPAVGCGVNAARWTRFCQISHSEIGRITKPWV